MGSLKSNFGNHEAPLSCSEEEVRFWGQNPCFCRIEQNPGLKHSTANFKDYKFLSAFFLFLFLLLSSLSSCLCPSHTSPEIPGAAPKP